MADEDATLPKKILKETSIAGKVEKLWKKLIDVKKQILISMELCSTVFSVFAPPQYVMQPQLQSTCHYIVNHCEKILHVNRGGKKYAPTKLM